MYQLFTEEHFDAAHYLRRYRGKCENLHGHRYKVIARIEAEELDESGLAFDLARLKLFLREIIAPFDHACLNDVPPFNRIEPSCENIAATIYDELKLRLSGSKATLVCVEAWESPTSGAVYTP